MSFYDDLADVYHLLYEDWPASIERQGRALDAVIRAGTPDARVVADVACGIGTQALGLAALGYDVIASDISARAIARAEKESADRGLRIKFRLDDMSRLSTYPDKSVDAVIACDNAVPHLLTDAEILVAFRQFSRVMKRGGTCVISVRDYAAIPRDPRRIVPYGVREVQQGKIAIFQVWDWDGERYDLHMYFVQDDGRNVDTKVFRSRYYAVSIARLIDLFTQAGFVEVRRVDDQYFQPLIVASVR